MVFRASMARQEALTSFNTFKVSVPITGRSSFISPSSLATLITTAFSFASLPPLLMVSSVPSALSTAKTTLFFTTTVRELIFRISAILPATFLPNAISLISSWEGDLLVNTPSWGMKKERDSRGSATLIPAWANLSLSAPNRESSLLSFKLAKRALTSSSSLRLVNRQSFEILPTIASSSIPSSFNILINFPSSPNPIQ